MKNNEIHMADLKGQTITFYSYKGGVGRSMGLVNIACLAAKENKKILLIDSDLEAPGLHQFFKCDEKSLGFVDLMADVTKWIDVEGNNNEEGYCRFMEQHLSEYIEVGANPVAGNADSSNTPNSKVMLTDLAPTTVREYDTSVSVDLIKAGRFDSEYSNKLNAIRWLDIYKKAPSFFRTFAYWLEKEYDYIFIDARTGLADTSGICTMLMPQKLILVFALNNQNINGVVDVAAQAIDYRFKSNDYRELQVFPLPSRIENSVNPYLQQWIENYKGKFEKMFTEKYALDSCDLKPYFDRSFIQYYPIHAYGENIPTLYENTSSSNFISYNYNNFLTVLKKNQPSWEVISTEEELKKERQGTDHFNEGYNLYNKKEYKAAIKEYAAAIEFKPDYYYAYNNRGIALEAIDSNNAAMDDYNMALTLKPDYELAFYNRGILKHKLKQFKDALKDFNKAIELKPDYKDAFIYRGLTNEALKQYDAALDDYQAVIKLQPDYADAYTYRGLVKLAKHLYGEAITDFSLAIELKPTEPEAYYNRGLAKISLKKFEDAEQDYNKALEVNPNFENALIGLGNIRYFNEQYKEAIPYYERAMRMNPKNADACIGRGASLYYLHDFKQSLEDNLRAASLSPDFDTPHINIAYVYRKQGEYKKAAEHLDMAEKLGSEDPFLWSCRAAICAAEKNDAGFYENIEKAVRHDLDLVKEMKYEQEVFEHYLESEKFMSLLNISKQKALDTVPENSGGSSTVAAN